MKKVYIRVFNNGDIDQLASWVFDNYHEAIVWYEKSFHTNETYAIIKEETA